MALQSLPWRPWPPARATGPSTQLGPHPPPTVIPTPPNPEKGLLAGSLVVSASPERELGVTPVPGPSPPWPGHGGRPGGLLPTKGAAWEGSRAQTQAAQLHLHPPAAVSPTATPVLPPASVPPDLLDPQGRRRGGRRKGLTGSMGRLPQLLFQLPGWARVRAVQARQAPGPRGGPGHGTRVRGLPGPRRKQVRWEASGSWGVGAEGSTRGGGAGSPRRAGEG